MSWQSKNINLGEVLSGTQVPFTFVYVGEKEIQSSSTNCTCTTSVVDGSRITGHFKPSRKYSGKRKTQNITVTFTDGTVDTVSVQADVK